MRVLAGKANKFKRNEVFMMNTRTLEQFDAMDVDMLAAVEGGGLGPIAGAAIGWDLGAISGAGLGWANFCQ